MPSNKSRLTDSNALSNLEESLGVNPKYAEELSDAIDNINAQINNIRRSQKKVTASNKPIKKVQQMFAERSLKQSTKQYVSSTQKASKTKSFEEMTKRTFSLSKGKKLLSFRNEKDFLRASNEQSKKLIEAYLKQGHSADSKYVKELQGLVASNDQKMLSLDGKIDVLKGGEALRQSELLKLNQKSKFLEDSLHMETTKMESLLADKENEIKELMSEGFSENDTVIKQLRKDQDSIRTKETKKQEKIIAEQNKIKNEVDRVKLRSSKFGDMAKGLGFGALASGGIRGLASAVVSIITKNPVALGAIATASGIYMADKMHDANPLNISGVENRTQETTLWGRSTKFLGSLADDVVGAVTFENQPKSSVEMRRFELATTGMTDKKRQGLYLQAVTQREGMEYEYNDRGHLAFGAGVNLGYTSIEDLRRAGVPEAQLTKLKPFIGKKYTADLGRKFRQTFTPQEVAMMNTAFIQKKSGDFDSLLFGEGRYLLHGQNALNPMQVGLLRAAYHNAPSLTEAIIKKYKNRGTQAFLDNWLSQFSRYKNAKTGKMVQRDLDIVKRYNIKDPTNSQGFAQGMKNMDPNFGRFNDQMMEKAKLNDNVINMEPISVTASLKRPTMIEQRQQAYGIHREARPELIKQPNVSLETLENIKETKTKVQTTENLQKEKKSNPEGIAPEQSQPKSHMQAKVVTES